MKHDLMCHVAPTPHMPEGHVALPPQRPGNDTLAVAQRALERVERLYTEHPSRTLRPVLRDLRAVVAELGGPPLPQSGY